MPQPWPANKKSFNSTELVPYWNYSIAQDFHSPSNTPASYVPGHPQTWDTDELDKIVFKQEVASVSVNADGQLLAFAVGNDIRIHACSDRREIRVLKGHTSKIEDVAWSSTDPGVLVSCAESYSDDDSNCHILVWDLRNGEAQRSGLTDAMIEQLARQTALNLDQDILDIRPEVEWTLSSTERGALTSDIIVSLTKSNARHIASSCTQLEGRLVGSRRSMPFSPDGKSLLFLPGSNGWSQSDMPCSMSILDMTAKQVRCELKGHTDQILWASFSPDSKLVGSACWDSTFRIWSADTGDVKHVFISPGTPQNWTAGFSPDGELFAGTAGSGNFYVWALNTGDLVASFKFGPGRGAWCRTLDWSPDGKFLAVSGQNMCTVMVVEPRAPEDLRTVQERRLSADACDEGVRDLLSHFLETTQIEYLPDGRLAFKMAGDRGMEVFDSVKNEKMRFAPPHVEEPQGDAWGGFVFCPHESMIASADLDAVRFWKV